MLVRRCALSLAAVLCACAPQTKYRRAALVPGPHAPPYRGEPSGRGSLEAQLQGSVAQPLPRVAEVGDPALWIPVLELDAAVTYGVTDFLDVGLLGSYAHGSFAAASALGTPALVSSEAHLLAVGPQLGLGHRFAAGRVFLGAYAALQYVRLPWVEYRRVEDTAQLPPPEPRYVLHRSGAEHGLHYRVGGFVGGRPLPWLALHAGLVCVAAWTNVGFSAATATGSTLRSGAPSLVPLLGARFEAGRLFATGGLTFPISFEDEVEVLPIGGQVALGLRFDLLR